MTTVPIKLLKAVQELNCCVKLSKLCAMLLQAGVVLCRRAVLYSSTKEKTALPLDDSLLKTVYMTSLFLWW